MTQLDTNAALADLAVALPADALITDLDALESDRTGWHGAPLAMVRPTSEAHVAAALRWATRYRVPVVTIGNGSRLSGDVVTTGALIVSMTSMATIVIDHRNQIVVAQAGAPSVIVTDAVKEIGGFLPLSTSDAATIGGDVALDELGTSAAVVEMRVVLADGTALRVAGPLLADGKVSLGALFADAAGLLGVITEITLFPYVAPECAVRATFTDAIAAADACVELAAARTGGAITLTRSPGGGSTVVLACDSAKDAPFVADVYRALGATSVTTDDDVDAALPSGTTLPFAISVPLTRFGEWFAGVAAVEREQGVAIAVVAQPEDERLRPVVVHDRDDDRAIDAAYAALATLLDLAQALELEVSGEIRAPRTARTWLAARLGDCVAETDQRMKLALDPLGLLNPGLVY